MVSSQTLTSLAMLKVDLDQHHRSYVDYLVPFAIEILAADRLEVISDVTVADGILAKFGLRIPAKVVQHVLRRLQRKGYLHAQDGVLTINPKSVPQSSLVETRRQAEAHIAKVIAGLISEASARKITWSADDATRAVTSFLGQFSIDCLRTYVFNTALPTVPESTSPELYIVSSFIRRAQLEDGPTFESFIVLVKGLMYSHALLCPDLESLEKKFQDVVFYLDTPLVLNLLGLQGEEAKRAADELAGLLIALKGSLAVFSHTVSEIQRVISFAAYNYDNFRAKGRILEETRRSGVQLSELVLIRDSLDERLKQHGIRIKKTPPYDDDLQIGELELQAALQDEAVYYSFEAALRDDINSVRSIYVLRKGRLPVRLEDAGAVFVTTNQGFARAAFHAGRNHNSSREVSAVITAYSLTNIAWLKSPIDASSLPARETMALCYAALEPSEELFRKYVEESEKLLKAGQISTRDHEILRLSPSAREELMELTLGDDAALTATSVRSILANAKAAILAEQKELHERELEAIAAENEQRLADERARVAEMERRIRSVEENAEAAKAAAEQLRVEAIRRNEVRARRCMLAAKLVVRPIIFLIVPVLIVGLIVGAGLVSPDASAPAWIRWTLLSFAVIAILFGVFNWYHGTSLKGLAAGMEGWLAKRIERWLTDQ